MCTTYGRKQLDISATPPQSNIADNPPPPSDLQAFSPCLVSTVISVAQLLEIHAAILKVQSSSLFSEGRFQGDGSD